MRFEDVKVGMRVVRTEKFDDYFNKHGVCEVVEVCRDGTVKLKKSNGEEWRSGPLRFEPYKPEFKVGDRVRIRSWESMEREFGSDSTESIKCHPRFRPYMKHLCGREVTIGEIEGTRVHLTDWSDGYDTGWYYSIHMLEKIEEEEEKKEIEIVDKMEEVARILGVVKGEKFEIEGDTFNPYTITDKGLIDTWRSQCPVTFTRLLRGIDNIIKLPFKPAKGENYWSVRRDGCTDWAMNDRDKYDCNAFLAGNCFRTKEEAEAAAPEIIKKMQEFFGIE